MLLLNAEEIRKCFTMKDAIDAVKTAYAEEVSGGIDSPLRTVIAAHEDDSFIYMPSYSKKLDAAAVKIISIFPANPKRGLDPSPAQIVLTDGDTGYVVAMLDGTYVTRLRTGASTGAAFDVLGKKDCRIGGLIGTGSMAAAQLEAMVCVRELEEVRIFDLDLDHCRKFCADMQEKLASYGTKFVPVASSDEAAEEADLFITMTPSPKPVFDGTKIKKGATISCVGTFQPEKHEMDPAVLPRASKIICDLKEAALAETGDLLIPIKDGIITEDDIDGSIGEVINGTLKGRENDDEIIVYETVGIAAQDLVTSKRIYDRAVELGAGTEWE